MKYFVISALLLVILLTPALESRKKYKFIGLKKCIQCHGQDEIGNQYSIWLNSPHAKAALRLFDKKAVDIAKKYGIDAPEKSRQCLKCHTTGAGRYPALNEEGVGCEACHGPAEKWHNTNIHVDYTNKERAYKKAISYGMYPVIGITHIHNRDKLCNHCHNKKRLCYPEKREDIKRQTISPQTISEMKKGDINLNHPLRR